MKTSISSDQFKTLISEGNWRALSEIMDRLHPAAVVGLCEELTADETWRLLDLTPLDRQAEVFPLLSGKRQVAMVGDVGRNRMSQLLKAMPHDDRVDLLKRLNPVVVENLLPLVSLTDPQIHVSPYSPCSPRCTTGIAHDHPAVAPAAIRNRGGFDYR